MDLSAAPPLVFTLGLVGLVVSVAAMLSGLIDRSGLPQVGVFLALGAALGPFGLGLLDVTLQSPILQAVATVSLLLVLFTDAVTLDVGEVRRHAALAVRVLGPGTLLCAALTALAGWQLLHLPPAAAAILGAALASTDPVMLRGLLRRPGLSPPARLALRLESGLNDAVLLPIILVAMSMLAAGGFPSGADAARLGMNLFLLGPGAGVAAGLLALAALDLIRRRIGVRRDYESLYSLGVAFTAYAAAEALHGSGFLAAFAAGLTIAALDVELCDCFVEYGETTGEMALLFTFVLFGGFLIWRGILEASLPVLLFASLVVVIRPLVFLGSLAGTTLSRSDRLLIAWFGPRGLSSLLLVLVPVFAGVPGAEPLFVVCCFVVLLSVALHGGSLMLRREGSDAGRRGQPAPAAAPADPAPAVVPAGVPDRVTVGELRVLWAQGAPLLILDVRSEQAYGSSPLQASGALRIPPGDAVQRMRELRVPHQTRLVAFCA